MVVTLRVLVGPELAEEISISTSTFTIGRAEDCNLRPSCPLVSRHHCELVVHESSVSIRDIHSKNGTYVNGHRIDGEQQLRSGDQLGVGLRRLAVLIEPNHSPAVSSEVGDLASRSSGRQEDVEEMVACLSSTPA